jgi:dipeptidyl aminopeptidase/acylaminoacyl peptidase
MTPDADTMLDRYRRAEAWLPWNMRKLIRNAVLEPYWIDADRFWWKRETEAGWVYEVTDARTLATQPAFDHTALAAALAHTGHGDVTAARLPLQWIKPGEGATDLATAQGRYRFDGATLTRLADPAWHDGELPSPDRRFAAFRRGDDLWLRNLANGSEQQLTHDGEHRFGYATSPGSTLEAVTQARSGRVPLPVVLWSPDSKRLVTHRLDERRVREVQLLEAAPKDGDAIARLHAWPMAAAGDAELPLATLIVFDAETGARTDIAHSAQILTRDSPIERGTVWWNASGETVFFLDVARADIHFDVVRVDVTTGAASVLWREQGSTYVEANIGWNEPVFFPIANGERFVLLSERDGWAHLHLHDGRSGAPLQQLTSGNWVVRNVLRIDEAAGRIVFSAGGVEPGADPYLEMVYSVGLDGADLRRVTPDAHEHVLHTPLPQRYLTWGGYPDFDAPRPQSLSPTAAWLAVSHGLLDRTTQTSIVDLRSGTARRLFEAETAALEDSGWRFPIPVQLKAADGETDIYGAVFLPTHYDPAKTYPVLDAIYPGPQTIRTPKIALHSGIWAMSAVAGNASLAELGFIVVVIDGVGGPWRSKAFHDVSYKRLQRAGGLEDHIAGIRQLAETYAIDLERIGMFGFSGGGTATARALLEFPDVFKAGVAAAGSHDLRGYFPYWGEKYQGPYDPETFEVARNGALAANLKGKLLLIAGELDDNCHPAMTLQLADALTRANKDFDLLILTGHNHLTAGGSGYYIRRIWDYFVRHLQGATPPAGYRLKGPFDAL